MDAKVTIADGIAMPVIGLGTYRLDPRDVPQALDAALAAGYRLVDTATVYRNEEAIGRALEDLLPRHGLSLDDVFVTSKLAPADHGYETAIRAVGASRERLGLARLGRPIDLYLVHWPGKGGLDPADPQAHCEARQQSWLALEECLRRGWVRAIGVSNYELGHLEEMGAYATVGPAVHQLEAHPHYMPVAVIDWCARHRVFVQAYASLGRGLFLQEAFLDRHPAVRQLLARYRVGPAQLFLRWALEHGWGVLPKATAPGRVRENAGCAGWRMDPQDVAVMDRLVEDPDAGKICWDPRAVA